MSLPLAHYVSDEAFDPEATVAPGSAPSERYLERLAGADHLVALPAAPARLRSRCASSALSYFSILVTEFLAPYDLHSRHTDFIYAPPQRVHLFHEGRFVGPFVYPLRLQAQHGHAEARIHARHVASRSRSASSAPASPTISGACSTAASTSSARRKAARCSCSAPTGSGATCSRGSSTARASRSPIGLVGVTLSYHDRHHHRRHRRLFRRPVRFRRAARHRGAALDPGAAALDGALGGAAGDLGSAAHLFRHHASSWRCSTGRASRAPCAPSSSRCARRITSRRRR